MSEHHLYGEEPKGRELYLLAFGALGIVYGDIGTSPLYAFRESFHSAAASLSDAATDLAGAVIEIFNTYPARIPRASATRIQVVRRLFFSIWFLVSIYLSPGRATPCRVGGGAGFAARMLKTARRETAVPATSTAPAPADVVKLNLNPAIGGREALDYQVPSVFGGYLLFYFAFRPMWLTESFNRLPDISYGVYLYGWPVQTLLVAYLPPVSPWLKLGLACVIVLPLSVLSCYLVEQPMLRWKNARRRVTAASVGT